MIYQTTEAAIEIEVRADADTVWLNRQQMAVLFGRERFEVSLRYALI
jgi:hypothetical protein